MRTYLVKEKLRLGGERFTIKDDKGEVAYQVEGSFFEIPKRFSIYGENQQLVSEITKKVWSFLPQFVVKMADGHEFFIKKQFTFWRDKYSLENLGLSLQGNIWDINFWLIDKKGNQVAEISKKLFHLTSTYQVEVYDDSFSDVVISLVVALDYVEMQEKRKQNKY